MINKKAYRENLVELVKAAGQELIDRAPDLVGDGDMITSFNIWLRFPQDAVPTVEVTREHMSKRSFDVLVDRETE